ncbi:hypothetical protein VRK_41700 [Vibrio sp. MEBiC08052]|nr:hypothetical protein VRK_41700 [Vibrio sp. MEBiC08052]
MLQRVRHDMFCDAYSTYFGQLFAHRATSCSPPGKILLVSIFISL